MLLVANSGIGQNHIQNPGFEDGSGALPDGWTTIVAEGTADFQWVTEISHSGAKSVRITHSDSATSSLYQVIPVLPDYLYKVSGYIMTAGVDAGSDWFEGGAQIVMEGDVKGDWWDNMTERLAGDSGWTRVELEFTTLPGATAIELHCRLGAGLKIKGTAWFDDIMVEEARPSGRFFRNGGFEEETLILNREDPNWNGGWFLEFDEFSAVGDGTVSIGLDTTIHHGGKQSLKFYCVAGKPTGWIQVMQNGGPYPEGLVDGAQYKISGWIKTAGDASHIRMRCGENGDVGAQLAGDNDWTYREGIIDFDEDFYNTWGFLGLAFWKENTPNSGTVWYDDIQVERVQTSVLSDSKTPLPDSPELVGNYPNPFNPCTTIVFSLPAASTVRISVYNLLGRKVAAVAERDFQPGEHRIVWSADSGLSSGVYYYELKVGDYRQIEKMILMR